jgi:hypothetical protein
VRGKEDLAGLQRYDSPESGWNEHTSGDIREELSV